MTNKLSNEFRDNVTRPVPDARARPPHTPIPSRDIPQEPVAHPSLFTETDLHKTPKPLFNEIIVQKLAMKHC